MNWDDPEERLQLIERVGSGEYNRRLWKRFEKSVVTVVNGHKIRPAYSLRFGRLFLVGGTGSAFATIEEATEFAQRKDASG
jgi:hypothetical protein